MAAGDTLLVLGPRDSSPPATAYATHDTRPGGSTPAEAIPVLDFAPDASEYADWQCVMPRNYAGGGLTVIIHWMASNATSGGVRWEAALARVADDALDVDGDQSYDTNGVTATTASACGEVDYATITFTDGADMDSVVAGDVFWFRLYRDHDHANDDMANDAELVSIEIRETP